MTSEVSGLERSIEQGWVVKVDEEEMYDTCEGVEVCVKAYARACEVWRLVWGVEACVSVSVCDTLIWSFSSTQLQLPRQNPELMGVASRLPNKSCAYNIIVYRTEDCWHIDKQSLQFFANSWQE